jgi:hypothetical protein
LGTFPEQALAALNAAAVAAADAALAPAVRGAPLTTLLLVSAATGVAMLWVVGRTSNQAGMAARKRAMQAGLFEMRLFNDSLPAVLRALGRVLGHNARYLGYTLVPLAWMALPLLLLVAQLQAFYGYAGLTEGEPAVLTMRLRDVAQVPASRDVALEVPDGLRVDTPAVVLPGTGEVVWRLTPTAHGEHLLAVRIGSRTLTKTVRVGGAEAARRSPRRVGGALLDQALYPSEPPLPAEAAVAELRLAYPAATVPIAGLSLHWLTVFIVVSVVTAFALARRLGVVL